MDCDSGRPQWSATDKEGQKEMNNNNENNTARVEWVRLSDGMPNNSGRPWFGQGLTASYRIDCHDDWAVLSVFGDGWGYGHGVTCSYGSATAAKRAAVRIEMRRQSEAVAPAV
jgi:hypothetical protein